MNPMSWDVGYVTGVLGSFQSQGKNLPWNYLRAGTGAQKAIPQRLKRVGSKWILELDIKF